MVTETDMARRNLMASILKAVFGCDTEMRHPKVREEADKMANESEATPTKGQMEAKIQEAHEAIDQAKRSTDRVARFQPARSISEALSQITGVE